MKGKKILLSGIIVVLLVFGPGVTAFAQVNGFFVEIAGRSTGPHDETALRQMVDNGQLTRNSLVWREGMTGWAAAETIVELASLFAGLPPSLLGAPPPLPHQIEPWGGHPAVAGLVNIVVGIWSFTSNDLPGGLMTAGLQIGGAAVSIIGTTLSSNWYWSNPGLSIGARMFSFVGYGLIAAGTIYGFHRGFSQYNKRMTSARTFAEAINTNPMNNISITAFPTFDERRFVGTLTYSFSF